MARQAGAGNGQGGITPVWAAAFLEKKDLATVTHALVALRLDYRNVLCMGLPLEMAQFMKLQLRQNAAERMLVGASKFQHVTPILKKSCTGAM